jgi:hypothetical protein
MFKYRIRERALEMWDRQGPWSNICVIAENDDDAYRFFGHTDGEKPYFQLTCKAYRGSKKPGTKMRIW